MNKQKLQQILNELPQSSLHNASRCLNILQKLSDETAVAPRPLSVVQSLSECSNRSLAVSILTAAAERIERQEGNKARKWALAFDWMRHTLTQNDVEQLPSMVYAIEDLRNHKWGSAIKYAENAGGFTPEFMALVELWEW